MVNSEPHTTFHCAPHHQQFDSRMEKQCVNLFWELIERVAFDPTLLQRTGD
jgi:hypothetical protein